MPIYLCHSSAPMYLVEAGGIEPPSCLVYFTSIINTINIYIIPSVQNDMHHKPILIGEYNQVD